MRSIKQHIALLLAVVITAGSSGIQPSAAAKTSGASQYTVSVGAQIRLGTKKNATYKVSDRTVASVNGDGVVTGKKPGQVKVTVKSASKKTTTYSVTVNSVPKMPNLPVTFSEIAMVNRKMEEKSTGGYLYTAAIKNTSPATVKKVVYTYKIQTAEYKEVAKPSQGNASGLASDSGTSNGGSVGTYENSPGGSSNGNLAEVATGSYENSPGGSSNGNLAEVTTGSAVEMTYEYVPDESTVTTTTVTLTAKNIKAGKTSKAVTITGDYTGDIDKMKLVKIKLYAGKAAYVYKASDKSITLNWGVPDKEAPKFHGYTKEQSACRDIPYLTVYTDRRNNVDYTQFISATDDRKGKIDIDADTSGINWKKTGTYKVKLTATDKAGNKAKTWAWVSVVVPGTAESIADQVLSSITSNSWSKEQKARAIYRYVRGRMSYIQHTGHPDYRTAGVSGIRNCSGDCYTYYAVSRLLLTRAGIPNLMVTRYPVTSRHYWNLVYVNGGWYHFDTTPRSRGGTFCLLTDAQMHALYPGATFSFQTSLYPARATKRIS